MILKQISNKMAPTILEVHHGHGGNSGQRTDSTMVGHKDAFMLSGVLVELIIYEHQVNEWMVEGGR